MTTRQLGAVGLVLMGAWFFVMSLAELPDVVWIWTADAGEGSPWVVTIGAASTAACGVVLAGGATRLARATLADEEIGRQLSLDELLPLVFALAGGWLLVENAFHLARVALPFAFYEPKGITPWDTLAYDAATVVLAAVLFVKSRAIARLWLRLNPRAGDA
jgi:hypothetical protein